MFRLIDLIEKKLFGTTGPEYYGEKGKFCEKCVFFEAFVISVMFVIIGLIFLFFGSAFAIDYKEVKVYKLTREQRLEVYKIRAYEELEDFPHVYNSEEQRWFIAWKLAVIGEAVATSEGGYKNVLGRVYKNYWSLGCNKRAKYYYKCYKRRTGRWAAIFENDEYAYRQFIRTWIVFRYSSHNLVRSAKRYSGNWRAWYRNVRYWICKIDKQSFYYLCFKF